MNFKRFSTSDNQWHDTPYYQHKTATDTLTLPAVIYPNDTSITVGLKGNTVQSGTPTPDNPIVPQGTGERTGNLCEKVEAPLSQYRIYIENFKSIIDNYSTFTLIFNTQLSYSGNTLYLYTGSNTTLGYITGTGTITKTFNLNAENKEAIKNATNPYIFVYVNNVDQSSNTNAMLVSGSTPLPYEPYGYKIPISSASTTTPVYLGEVESTRRIKKLVLTGEEFWGKEGSVLFYNDQIVQMPMASYKDAYCSHYRLGSSYTDVVVKEASFGVSRRPALFIHDTRFSQASDFKSYLQQQYAAGTPVTVWYVLATEETAIVNEPLMKIGEYADSLTTSIPVTAGENTLDVQTTVQPSEVSAEFSGWHPVTDVHERSGGAWD